MFGPGLARIQERLGPLLDQGESVVHAARANIPARSEQPEDWVVLSGLRLLLVAAELGGPPPLVPGLAPAPPDAAAVRGIPLGHVVRLAVTPGTHRVLDGDILWSTFATLLVSTRDGAVERIGLRQPDADVLFDEMQRRCGLRAGNVPAADEGSAQGDPAPGGDGWVPLVAIAGVVLPLILAALLAGR